jgi:hypothetical protein
LITRDGSMPKDSARTQPLPIQSICPGAWASVSIANRQPPAAATRSSRSGGSWRSGRRVRRRFCEDCRKERHCEQARDWHREHADEVKFRRRATGFDEFYDPEDDPANRPPLADDVVHEPDRRPLGVRHFAREREEPPMPLSQLRTFTFPPPARLDEQRTAAGHCEELASRSQTGRCSASELSGPTCRWSHREDSGRGSSPRRSMPPSLSPSHRT